MLKSTPGSSQPSLTTQNNSKESTYKRALRNMSMTRSELVNSKIKHQISQLSEQVVQGDKDMAHYTKRLSIKECKWHDTVQ